MEIIGRSYMLVTSSKRVNFTYDRSPVSDFSEQTPVRTLFIYLFMFFTRTSNFGVVTESSCIFFCDFSLKRS